MAKAITPTIALEIEQKAEEVRCLPPSIRRIRHRLHLRQAGKALNTAYNSAGERRRPMADGASPFHDRARMLLVAEIRIASAPAQRVVLRNISAAGLMVEMEEPPTRGSFVTLNLGDLGWTAGTVVWKVGRRFGVMFDTDIDPGNVRRTIGGTSRAYKPTPPRRIF